MQNAGIEDNTTKQKLGFPYLVCLAFLFIEYGRPQDWLPVLSHIRPGMIVSLAAMGSLLVVRPALPKLKVYLLLFLFLMAAHVPFAVNNYWAFVYTQNFALLLFGAVFPIMAFVNSYDKFHRLIMFWVFIHVPLALYGVFHSGRGYGAFLGDENDFCLVMNMIIPYVVLLLTQTKSLVKKSALLVCLFIFLSAIVSSNSRGGFVGLVAVFVSMWIILPNRIRNTLLILVCIGFLFVASPKSYWTEMETISTASSDDDTGGARLYYWGIAWRQYLDNPVFGLGPANFSFNTTKYETASEQNRGRHVWGVVAHSLYFTLLPEMGTVGVVLFLIILLYGIKERRQVRKRIREGRKGAIKKLNLPEYKLFYYQISIAIDVALIAYLVTGAFVAVLYYPHFWLISAFSAALSASYDDTVKKESRTSRDDERDLVIV